MMIFLTWPRPAGSCRAPLPEFQHGNPQSRVQAAAGLEVGDFQEQGFGHQIDFRLLPEAARQGGLTFAQGSVQVQPGGVSFPGCPGR